MSIHGNKRLIRSLSTTAGSTTNDVQFGGLHTFTDVGTIGGFIVGAKISVNTGGGSGTYRVHLFKASPTLAGDGSVFTRLFSEDADYLGHFDLGTVEVWGSVTEAQLYSALRHPITLGSGGTLYAVCQLVGAGVVSTSGTSGLALTLDVEAD